MKKANVEAIIQGNKVTYKRYLDAPIDLVFEAWSTPEHVAEWWGPDGFTLTTRRMDFSNGGTWDFVMHGPDGRDYKNMIRFTDIVEPRQIHFLHLGDGEVAGHVHFEAKIRFEESGEGTKVTMEQIFPTKEVLEQMDKEYGAIEGAKQHIGNLAKYLAKLQ